MNTAQVFNSANLPEPIPQPLRDCFVAQQGAFAENRYPTLAERRDDLRALHRLHWVVSRPPLSRLTSRCKKPPSAF